VKNLTISPKQHEMFIALEDSEHTEIFLGGAAGGCPLLGSKINTIDGLVNIEDIKVGDLVLSYDENKKEMTYNKVLETFKKGVRQRCIGVKINGTTFNLTANHRVLYNKNWIEIGELARRTLEKDRQKWEILDKQQRKIINNELEKFWKVFSIQTGNNKERLFENSINFRREKYISSTSQISSTGIHSESKEQVRRKSQRLKQEKQFSRESRMGNEQGKLSPCREIRNNESIYGECRESRESTKKAGLPERNEQTNRATSQGDTGEIHPKEIRKKATRDRVRSETKHYQGYYKKKKLEACEINLDLIEEIKFFYSEVPAFDLEVENTYSYVLSKEKIIIHNSKSFTGCLWQIKRRLQYKGSRGFLARARLKDLKASTLLTFFEVCGLLGLRMGVDFKYNAQTGVIIFSNGSEEYLKDLFFYPSDPDFVSLGSTEYTDGFIDEMGDIGFEAYDIIRSRVRFKLDEFGLIPKIAMGSNPCKTFIYGEFYKKWRDNELEPYKIYVHASVYDNPFISGHYINNLKKLSTKNRERLLNGNWEYDDDPTKIFNYDSIVDLFTNEAKRGKKYCIVDQSGFGRDSCMVSIWDGLFITELLQFSEGLSSIELDKILTSRTIPRSHCLVDEIGVGFGLKKEMPEIIGFVANAAPLKKNKQSTDDEGLDNYKNLRSQCWFELANHVNSGMIGIYRDLPVNVKELLIEDLEVMKQMDSDKDAKMRVITKKELHDTAALSRSTDAGDVLMMRMYFEINPNEGAWTFTDPIDSIDEENKLKVYGESDIKTKTVDGQERRMIGDRILVE